MGSLGQAYMNFLDTHGFSPDERPPVRFVEDLELAYVMQRYRQVHDFAHVLLEMPPTVLGEVVVKWFELAQTGLPMNLLSAIVGPARLTSAERRVLFSSGALGWAAAQGVRSNFILNVYFEEQMDMPLDELRAQLGIVPSPRLSKLLAAS